MLDSPSSQPESDFVCACDERMRVACYGEPSYKTAEGEHYCVIHFPSEEKSADFQKALESKEDCNFRGAWIPEVSFSSRKFETDADFSHANFNAEADFSRAVFEAETNFILVKFKGNADFSAAKFKANANFSATKFTGRAHFDATFGAEANFMGSKFSDEAFFLGAAFGAEANFVLAEFNAEANFALTTFSAAASFSDATFSAKAEFGEATFGAKTDFGNATFNGEADFGNSTFNGEVNFRYAAFAEGISFAKIWKDLTVFTGASSLDLQFARIEKPDHVLFYALRLCPHWFVNVNASQFDFINVEWDWRSINSEIESLESKEIKAPNPHRLLAIACWHLAVNAEENHRYEEASKFRYMAMDTRRQKWREKRCDWRELKKTLTKLAQSVTRNRIEWRRTRIRVKRFGVLYWKNFDFGLIHWLYWAASGYGERIMRATVVLIGVLLVSAGIYTRVGFARLEPRIATETEAATATRDSVGAPLKLSRALTYSAGVMTLQRPEPKPASAAAQTVVLLETILGPVQAALLALAVRRQFMR